MSQDRRDIAPESVSQIWPVPTPARLRPVAIGTNNRAYIVECGNGAFYLKGHDNRPDPDRILSVSRLTAAITAERPPFAVPETIPSRSGEMSVVHGGRSWALSTFIPGTVARAGDRDDAFACGLALAELHAALARVDPGPGDAGERAVGDLTQVHPLVRDPARAIQEAIDEAGLAEDAMVILTAAQLRATAVTAGWPLTWIHWDFYPSNVLMEAGRVTGIVDFEFAGAGYRVMDVAIGLYAFAFGQPDMWTLIERFATGYLGRLPLASEEIEAIPTLLVIREATSLAHWTGRSLQGLPDRMGVSQRARRLIELAGFLDQHGPDLVARLHEIRSRPG